MARLSAKLFFLWAIFKTEVVSGVSAFNSVENKIEYLAIS